MRLSSVVISTSDDSEQVRFGVMDPETNERYILRAMVGVDAEEIIPRFYGVGTETGEKQYEFTLKPRNIVMRVTLNPLYETNEDVSEIRDRLFRLISANRGGLLTLRFMESGALRSKISGSIVKFEVPYFTQTPELQITVRCQDPMFRGENPVDIPIADLPSSNPVKVSDGASTAPHGLMLQVEFTASQSTFAIQDDPTTPDWKFEVTPSGGFANGDTLYLSSEYGAKELLLEFSGGGDAHVLDSVLVGSVWPQIFPGSNTLYFPQIANFDWLLFKYYPAFWGL